MTGCGSKPNICTSLTGRDLHRVEFIKIFMLSVAEWTRVQILSYIPQDTITNPSLCFFLPCLPSLGLSTQPAPNICSILLLLFTNLQHLFSLCVRVFWPYNVSYLWLFTCVYSSLPTSISSTAPPFPFPTSCYWYSSINVINGLSTPLWVIVIVFCLCFSILLVISFYFSSGYFLLITMDNTYLNLHHSQLLHLSYFSCWY